MVTKCSTAASDEPDAVLETDWVRSVLLFLVFFGLVVCTYCSNIMVNRQSVILTAMIFKLQESAAETNGKIGSSGGVRHNNETRFCAQFSSGIKLCLIFFLFKEIVAHNMQLLSVSADVEKMFTVEKCKAYYTTLTTVAG